MSTTHQLPVPAVHGDAAGVPGLGNDAQRVLIVDDDRSMRMILRRVLEQDRYEILEAEDGHEGVEACRESAPDIVLMDGAMPNMDGISACAAIRKLPGREETPILMITALEDEETINRAFDAGALAYITKPVNWSVLRQRVRRLIKARHAEQHIKYLAFHDALTGLPNRALFLNRLAHTIAQSQRDGRVFAVAFLDLDRFKTVNDTLGHDAGDTLLKTVADRLVTTLRTADTVARPSGDEFVMLLHMTRNADGLGDAARRMLHSISQPMSIVDQELIIGASVGVAVYPAHGNDITTLMHNADTAMYKVKEQGKNGVQIYSADMGEKILARMCLESRLRQGIENGEFSLNYQPIVDAQTRKVVLVEALARWKHPEIGFVPPDQFIPLAEETGDIHALGEWALATACADAKTWQALTGREIRISVNVSGRQFNDSEFPGTVRRVLRETRLAPQLLELELTESVIMHDAKRSIDMIQELKREGIGISVDDFGTGYSSLACLKRLPLTTLKIDRSFVNSVPSDPDDSAIVDAIAAMARRLRLTVVAEGVEEPTQANYLREIGCDYLQGYLFSRPVTAEALEPLLNATLPIGGLLGESAVA